MTERSGKGEQTAESAVFQVPPGTYELLRRIKNGRLGNYRTKRLIVVTSDPQAFPEMRQGLNVELGEGKMFVYMRIRQFPSRVEDDYFFTIDPQEKVVPLKSLQYGGSKNARGHEPSSPELFMRELQTAQKTQPKLKR